MRSSRLSFPRLGSDRPRTFRRMESIFRKKKSDQTSCVFVPKKITPYFCARLVAKAEGHASHIMARSPASQMTRKLLPGPMRGAPPAQGKSIKGKRDFTKVYGRCIFHGLLHRGYLERARLHYTDLDVRGNQSAEPTSTNFSTSMESGSAIRL